MNTSKIEWCDKTWNVTTGCSVVSPGCKNCYAMKMAVRLQRHPNYAGTVHTPKKGNGGQWTGLVRFDPSKLQEPTKVCKPQKFFVNSMSDLFHEGLKDEEIMQVFGVMVSSQEHTFQILTKRPKRVLAMNSMLPWQPNIWLGVSVEDDTRFVERVPILRKTGAIVKFLSCEPLLGDLPSMTLDGLHWVIAGGESGARPRKMEIDWVRNIRNRCIRANVPFFFKQWGSIGPDGVKRSKGDNGADLDGKLWRQFPRDRMAGLEDAA